MNDTSIRYVIADGLDVGFYRDIRDAQTYLEPEDVNQGTYVGYDAEGRLLRIETQDGAIVIEVAERTPDHAKELKELLRTFLSAVGAESSSHETLADLVRACERFR